MIHTLNPVDQDAIETLSTALTEAWAELTDKKTELVTLAEQIMAITKEKF